MITTYDHSKLDAMFSSNNRSGLIDATYHMARQLDQRYYRMEKKGIADQSVAYRRSQKDLGKDKPRYNYNIQKLEGKSNAELYKYAMELNLRLQNNDSSVSKLKKKKKEANEKTLEKILGGDATPLEKKSWQNFMALGGDKVLKNQFYGSENIVDDWQKWVNSGLMSNKEFLREFKRFKKINEDTGGKARKNLENLAKRKMERKKRLDGKPKRKLKRAKRSRR